MAALAPDRNLLFGLLALQNGLINQGQLVAAFQAWTLDKARALADHLVGRGDLEADDRSAVEALVARHLKKSGGDAEKSLAAIPTGRSTRAKLAQTQHSCYQGQTEGPIFRIRAERRKEISKNRRSNREAASDSRLFRIVGPKSAIADRRRSRCKCRMIKMFGYFAVHDMDVGFGPSWMPADFDLRFSIMLPRPAGWFFAISW